MGDIIAKDLLERIEKQHEKRRVFSKAGFHEISALHARVMTNIQLSLNVLLSGDLASAKQLVIEKTKIGNLEREIRARHLHRLMKSAPESIATSDLHLEVVRALKEINSLYTVVAYPILSKSGALLDTRIDIDATSSRRIGSHLLAVLTIGLSYIVILNIDFTYAMLIVTIHRL